MKTPTFFSLFLCGIAVGAPASAGPVTIPHEFVAGEPAIAGEVNDNFSAIETSINDNDNRIDSLETGASEKDARLDTLELTVSDHANRLAALEQSPVLTSIQHLSWQHQGAITFDEFVERGVALAFSDRVVWQALTDRFVLELYRFVEGPPGEWVRVAPLTIEEVVDFATDADGVIREWTVAQSPSESVEGIVVTPPIDTSAPGVHRIVIRGNFVPDIQGLAVDPDFLTGVLPTGDGVPGGLFESWFDVAF